VNRAYPPKETSHGAVGGGPETINAESNPPFPALEVRSLSWEHVLNGISLTVGKGEIVGLGGLDGQGQSELLLALFGVLRGVEGRVLINGAQPSINHPRQAKASMSGWL
jgi:ribose transport system ATP-binding protein